VSHDVSPVRPRHEPLRVVRVIARLNVGGPAIQAITLTKRLEEQGYRTTLVRGREDPAEGNMDYLAGALGVRPLTVPALRRNTGWRDVPAFVALVRIIVRERPHIVHTHAAKAGTLGRLAALAASIALSRRPVLVHTFHGHSLTGYFSPRRAAIYASIERWLAVRTDCLIAVSEEVRDDLVALGVAPAAKFSVVSLGFELSPFAIDDSSRACLRRDVRGELGIAPDAPVITLVARLVPIKRVDRFLRVARGLRGFPGVRFLIVGDGELRESLQSSSDARELGDRLIWAGFRRDMPGIYFASDVVVQTSDNEGTPVSLIEAQAAGVPVVSTRVGGTASVVSPQRLAAPDDVAGMIDLVRDSLTGGDAVMHRSAEIRRRFDIARLVDDIVDLYERHSATR
jgi:glycosyltransferase involved in cell wall biosynthesis